VSTISEIIKEPLTELKKAFPNNDVGIVPRPNGFHVAVRVGNRIASICTELPLEDFGQRIIEPLKANVKRIEV